MGDRLATLGMGRKTSYDVYIVKIGPLVQPLRVTKRPKKERQRQKPFSGKLGIRRDHPRRRIEMKFCLMVGLQMIVLRFEFHQNRLSGFGTVGVEICPSPLTWPLAYTTACTTVQAVQAVKKHGLYGSTSGCIRQWPSQ